MLGVCLVFSAALVIEALIYMHSMRGTMLQTAERAAVPGLLFAHLLCSALDVAMSILGVVLSFQSNLFDRVSCMAGDRARTAVLVVVLGNWLVLLTSFLVVSSTFNMFSGVEAEESWRKRLACLGGLLRGLGVAGLVGADTDPLSDSARTFAHLFSHVDFVASDFATALVLVGISHAEEGRRREEAEWAALQAGPADHSAPPPERPAPAEAPLSASSVADDASEGSEAESRPESRGSSRASLREGDSRQGFRPATPHASTPLLGSRGPPGMLRPGSLAARNLARGRDAELDAAVSEAQHFASFALAPYGWPLYLWAHPRCGACDLCCGCGVRSGGRRRHACWRRTQLFGGPHGAQDALDVAALARFADLDEDDLLHVSFYNSVLGALPYAICRDAKTKSIVLSVRGTLSVADCITDLLYEPAGLDGTVLGGAPGSPGSAGGGIPAGSFAHSGVLGCARALQADLLRHRALQEALAQPGWQLVLTGHSLGAGVATLLGLMLRPSHPGLRVWAFSPPGGLLSEALAQWVSPWCTSVVLGNDFICRLSMPNLERLRDEMMAAAARARVPKFTILRRAAVAGPHLRASEVMYPPNHYGAQGAGAEVEEALARYSASVAAARGRGEEEGAGKAAHVMARLYPPGRLLHLVRMGKLGRREGAALYMPRWTNREQLMSRVVVARNVRRPRGCSCGFGGTSRVAPLQMFSNHLPDQMARGLAIEP